MSEDIRWFNQKTDERVTYIQSLKAELKHRNHWLYENEWRTIEEIISDISEEEAKKQCFIIRDKIRDRVDYDRLLYE